jgi:hypothetical protein
MKSASLASEISNSPGVTLSLAKGDSNLHSRVTLSSREAASSKGDSNL